tara:strand:+ start:136 stop:1503 length:1368 start_codon:yes stop_codon:yes gene_type:complete
MKNLVFIFFIFFSSSYSQDDVVIKNIFDTSLTKSKAYEWLDYLSNQIGGRLSGSLEAQRAIEYTKSELDQLGFDKVWLQPVMVPRWVRGPKEFALIETEPGITFNVPITALGGSVATPSVGLKANVIEVFSLKELEELGKDKIDGKIVFFNRPMEPEFITTFTAYGRAVDQRALGAMEASKYGAIGVIVRSMTLRTDDYPHTGGLTYGDLPASKRIPGAAISTNGADKLSSLLKIKPDLKFLFRQQCKQLPDSQSYNVIAEKRGSEFPDEIILVGGHLDSWDIGDGSHDDGAGVVHSMDLLNIFNKINYNPKRTIRVVLYINEENGLRGSLKYKEVSDRQNLNHIFAIESDAGGFRPLGFSFTTNNDDFIKLLEWKKYFAPYFINVFIKGGSGADIANLKSDNNILAGLRPNSQRYFDYHHTEIDTFDAINKRELEMGSGAIASLVYLFDKYGLR